jgi:hypothetical protein
LDRLEAIQWEVVCEEKQDYIKLESRPRLQSFPGEYHMRVYIRKRNTKIVAVQPVRPHVTSEVADISQEFEIPALEESDPDVKVVWLTKPRGISYSGKTTVVEVEKPGMARYLGKFCDRCSSSHICWVVNLPCVRPTQGLVSRAEDSSSRPRS